MCGIAGFFRTDGVEAVVDELQPLLQALRHRGPDGSAGRARGRIAIGATRLAIIDVAGGQQPIYNETSTVAIVCNGEIYNYHSLRRDLERARHRFRTKTDIEVILHLYEDLGAACFEKLNGMFAVAIADFAKERLILARDPFGQKPLYLWRGPMGWAFASELKALTTQPGFARRLAPTAVSAFLQFRYVPAPLTMFADVSKLPPGSVSVIDGAGQLSQRRYFQLDLGPTVVGTREDPTGTLTRDALKAAVERHLMSERPLGVFLSGGVDSSAIVACMRLNGHQHIRTFTVGFKDFEDSELDTGREVAQQFATEHREVILDPETFWESLREVVHAADEPLADLTTVPLYHLARVASHDVVVVLSGEGADELLGGYNGFEFVRGMFDRLQRLKALAPLARTLLPLPWPEPVHRKLQTLAGTAADYLARTRASATDVFGADFRKTFLLDGATHDVSEPVERYYRERQSWDGLHLSIGEMLEWWLPDDLLHKADRMTMAHSVELRCPFLDVEFARHCAALGLDSKVKSLASEASRKIALKQAFKDHLPAGLTLRKKRGFPLPAYTWIQTVYRERMQREMERESPLGSSVVPRSVRRDLFERAAAGDRASQRRLWSIVVLNKWSDCWL